MINLNQLVDEAPDIEVGDLRIDSRAVQPGDAFVALGGDAFDGHDFAAQAEGRGAAAVLSERAVKGLSVANVVVPDLAQRCASLADTAYGQPSADLRCIGCTGTNGKTTISFQVASLLAKLGHTAGYLGTIGWGLADAELKPARLTTEDVFTTQRRLRTLVDAGAGWVALEASSHALDQGRLDHVRMAAAVFTNLTRDHLDYHGDMASYEAAKARLFQRDELELALACADDPAGARMLASAPAVCDRLSYGLASNADVRVRRLPSGLASVATPWGAGEFKLPGIGDFSAQNLAAVIALGLWQGADFDAVLAAAEGVAAAPGRAQQVGGGPGQPTVVIDYAHTPDALRKVLAACRSETSARVVCVFGCGGDRDKGKRPEMAEAAGELADEIWLTSDNPRGEDPLDIIADVQAGLPSSVPCMVDVDRARAIEGAVMCAGEADIVLVAGKGHEDYQEIGGDRRPFSDLAVVEALLVELSERSAGQDMTGRGHSQMEEAL